MAHDLPLEEYERRLQRVREAISASGDDLWIITRPENIYYLSGYRAAHIAARTAQLHGIFVPADGEPVLIGRSLEAETTTDQRVSQLILLDDDEDPYAAMHRAIPAPSWERIGVEERFLSVRQLKRLTADLADPRVTDITGRVEALAASPSPGEVASLREAALITQAGLEAGATALRPGAKIGHIVGEVHRAMYLAGQTDFDRSLVAVWAGPRGGAMHDTRVTHTLDSGDVATIEIMGVHHHYRVGVQSCWSLAPEPAPSVVEAYRLVLAMHDAARAAVRAGTTAGDVFAAADAVFREARGVGYHRRVGGSMGLTNFAVDLTRGNPARLTVGQPFLIQTLVDDPALLTHASTVLVTENGCEALTEPPRELLPMMAP